jgi:hypothetical protein
MFEEPNYVTKRTISADAQNLIRMLLDKSLKKRLVPEKIPNHPFFKKINFDEVAKMKIVPPFKPKVKGLDDLSNIDPAFLREEVVSPVKNHRIIHAVEQRIY